MVIANVPLKEDHRQTAGGGVSGALEGGAAKADLAAHLVVVLRKVTLVVARFGGN